MFSVSIVLGETVEEAKAKKARAEARADQRSAAPARIPVLPERHGFSKFPLDEPLAEVKTNASRGLTMLLTSGTGKSTLRRDADRSASAASISSAQPTASLRRWAMRQQEMGGDGS